MMVHSPPTTPSPTARMTRTAAAGKQQQSEAIQQQTGAGESGLQPASQTGESIQKALSQTKTPDSLLDEALGKLRAASGLALAPLPMQLGEGAVDKGIESGPALASLPQNLESAVAPATKAASRCPPPSVPIYGPKYIHDPPLKPIPEKNIKNQDPARPRSTSHPRQPNQRQRPLLSSF